MNIYKTYYIYIRHRAPEARSGVLEDSELVRCLLLSSVFWSAGLRACRSTLLLVCWSTLNRFLVLTDIPRASRAGFWLPGASWVGF